MNESTPAETTKLKQFFKLDPAASIISVVAVYFVSQIVAIFLVSLYPATRSWTEEQSYSWLDNSVFAQFFYVLIAEFIAVFLIFRLVKLARVSLRAIGFIKPRLKDVGWAFIAYGLYFLCFLAVSLLTQALIPALDFDQKQQIGFENAYSDLEIVLTFISLVVLVPFAEEVMFRGFLFTSLRAKYKYLPSVIITSVIFGIAHLQFGSDAPLLWVAAIDTFILSCFLCFMRERMASLWPAVFLHMIKNSLAFLILFGSRFVPIPGL